MKVLIVNHEEVRQLLPMDQCIEAVEQAFKTLAQGDAVQPLRTAMWLPDRSGLLGMMPGYLGGEVGMMGIKVVSVMPGNHGSEYDSHQGSVMLFEKEHGIPKAIVDAGEITGIRTAAASAVATRLLARSDSHHLAILGSGVQARTHLEAMRAVRDIRQIRVWSRNQANAAAFATWAAQEHGVKVLVMPDVPAAVRDADLICTTTAAPEPILKGAWIAPGTHVNAVGSSVKFTRELDTQAVVRARLFVDRRESTLNEAGDFLFPRQEGAVADDHIVAELGEILLGEAQGRRSSDEVTLFKSLGLAVEDVAAAHHVYRRALAEGAGKDVEIGGKRPAH